MVYLTPPYEVAMKDTFSTLDIVKALKIPRERLREWTTRSFIKPQRPASGKGTKAIFSLWEVYGVALFLRLVEHGFDRKFAAKCVAGFLEKIDLKNSDVAYIGFRFPALHDKTGMTTLFYSADWKLDWRPIMAIPVQIPESDPGFFVYSEEWEQIHMINFKKLRAEVDASLAML
jgi:hypothetical protein